MYRVTIQYAVPDHPAAFERRYVEAHVPLVLRVPGLRAFSWSTVRPMVGEQTVYLVAQLDFVDREAMKAGLGSPEMATAAQDAEAMGVARAMFSGEVYGGPV